MKVNKNKLLYVLAKYMIKLMSPGSHSESQYAMVAASLVPVFNMYKPKLVKADIIDDTDRLDIDKLKEKSEEFFEIVPTLQIPIQGFKINITKKEVSEFIKDLYHYADVEEVIYLPCQN